MHRWALPQWVRYPARIVLGSLALAGGGNALATGVADALPSYEHALIQPFQASLQPSHSPGHMVSANNEPYGYEVDEIPDDTPITEVASTTNGDYIGAKVTMHIVTPGGSQTVDECVWLNALNVTSTGQKLGSKDSLQCIDRLNVANDPFSYSYRLNRHPHNSDDGLKKQQSPSCDGAVYAHEANVEAFLAGVKLKPSISSSPLWDKVGTVPHSSPIFYRFTLLDNLAIMVRTNEFGWGWMESGCATGNLHGGPPNSDRTRKQHQALQAAGAP